jgi:hypothetical protein
MEVKRKALGIALEMVTSRNVEDVVLFLKKQLQSTMESEFDKVRKFQQPPPWLLTDPLEPRVPPAPYPEHSLLRHQVLGGRRERGLRPHGLPRRLQQPVGGGRYSLRPVGLADGRSPEYR